LTPFETIATAIDSAQPLEHLDFDGPAAGGGRTKSQERKSSVAAPRPLIQIVGGKLPEIIDQAEDALIASEPHLYRYGGQLVRPVLEEVPAADMTRTQVHRLLPVTRSYLVDVLTTAAHWQRFDRRREDWVDVDCPDKVADVYLAREGQWRLPPLVGIINAPMLRADGTLLEKPGYDERTGLLFRSDEVTFGRVPARPSRVDAENALCRLQDLISTFPFVGDGDRSVALSAILSALDRRAMDAAPMHAFSAPVAGSGKTMLVDLCSMIATGRKAPVLDQSKDDVETDKRLVAALLRGGAIIAIDNVDRPLDSALLCQALTSSGVMQLRVLGSSRDVDVPNRAMFYATGNNLVLAGDLTRRTLLCRLDPGCERPELREFNCDPLVVAKEDRAEYVVAALTILRAYHTADERITINPLGSYETWSRRVREALVWLGCSDPCETMTSARRADPVTTQLSSAIAAWRSSIGINKPLPSQAVVEIANRVDLKGAAANPDLREALLAVAGEKGAIDVRRLGKWLAKNEDRVIDGHKITRADAQTSAARWFITAVSPVSCVSLSQFPSRAVLESGKESYDIL
jgi:putative DNA primase/helicase